MFEQTTNSHIVVHHLAESRSQRIVWLLEELNLPYEVKKYARTPQRRAPKELYDIHPLGKSPVIVDGDVTIAESGAIIDYLIEKYGAEKFKVKVGTPEWRDNLYFSHYPEGSVQPLLVRKLLFRMIPDSVPPEVQPTIRSTLTEINNTTFDPELGMHADFIEGHLQKLNHKASNKGWFAGGDEPTSADFMMSFTLEVLVQRSPGHTGPLIKEYVQRVQSRCVTQNFSIITPTLKDFKRARPAYKRAIERVGDSLYLLKN
ncbi:glutathione S transferase [Panaeolus papilionaceus]|nr:glutathione S transferase [Panaeolus papilionaceus]